MEKVRIAQLQCDWKDRIADNEINKARKDVGGVGYCCDYDQGEVDSKVMFVSSINLTWEQLNALWNAGDLMMGDRDFWEGDSVEEIVEQLDKYLTQMCNVTASQMDAIRIAEELPALPPKALYTKKPKLVGAILAGLWAGVKCLFWPGYSKRKF